MAVTVQSIVDRVQATIQDTTGIRWPQAELLYWVNDAQREIVFLKPEANATTTVLTLVAGTKQSLPADGLRLMRVTRNMSGVGGTGGRTIRLVSREALDAQDPSWHDPAVTGRSAHGTLVRHYTYDAADPTIFYVYPGMSGTAYIEATYAKQPTTLIISDNLELPDHWSNAIVDYVLYRVYAKDAEYAGSSQRSLEHYQLFMSAVGAKSGIDQTTSPSVSQSYAPNMPGYRQGGEYPSGGVQ